MNAVCKVMGAIALMTVVAGPLAAQEKIKEGAANTKDAVVKGAKVGVAKTKDGLSKTGEVMTDGWITTRVHSRFVGEALLKNSDISVDTDNHVVTLKGTVKSRTVARKRHNPLFVDELAELLDKTQP
jgi:hyperosmotically inducible periplasmic protein